MAISHSAALAENTRRQSAPDIRKTGLNPDYWYPVARSRELKKGKLKAVSFAGEPVVLARAKNGTLFALENRCAHRQVPLVHGVLDGEELQCGYHCWRYDKTGRCVNVPYLDKQKSLPNGVHAYPCREEYGLIFIYPGALDNIDGTPFPDIPTFHNPRYKTRYLDRAVRCHYSFMHENLMDMNHQFLHRRLMGGIRTVFLELRRDKKSVEVDYTFARVSGKQHLGEKFILKRIKAPDNNNAGDRDLMTIRTEYPYQSLRFWTAGSSEPALDLWNVYIPVDREQRINHTYGLMMFRKPPIPGLMELLWPVIIWFTEGIFAEDRWIVEEEQKAFDNQGADWNQEIFPVIRALRELIIEKGVPLQE